nr:MAG TPA: minor structural protein [Caudoviricetes sp.]
MDWLKKLVEKHTKDGILDVEALNKEIATEFPKHAVPKETYNTLAETKTKLENDIKDRDKQLEDLKKVDAAGLQAEIEKLQTENKTAKEKYEADMKDLTLTNAIKLAVAGKVHDESIVSGLVDKSKLIIGDDGKIVGLDEQINSLKESKAFLFKEVEDNNQQQQQKPGFNKIGNPPPNNPAAMDDAIAAAFGNTTEQK